MKDHHVAWSMCPHCGALHDGALNTTGEDGPEDGDPSICAECCQISVFDSGRLGGRRLPTKSELARFAHHTELMRAQRAAIAARNLRP